MRRAGHRLTAARRFAALVGVVSLSLVAGTLGTTSALAEPKPTIAEVQARVDELNEKAEHVAEQYNAGQIELDRARTIQRASERAVREAEKRMGAHRSVIGEMAADAYRSGGSQQTSLAVLMTADDPTAVMDRLSTLGAIERRNAAVLRDIEVSRQELEQAQTVAKQMTAEAETLAADAAKKKAEVERLLGAAKSELNRLTAAERARIAAEKAAKARAEAAEAARFLAAQRAAEQRASTPSPSSGGGASSGPQTKGGKGKAAGAVQAALSKLGKPYVWAAAGPNSFDCSGLIMWAYAQVGVSVPHYTGAIWNGFPRVDKSDLRPGDIVFFYPDVHHAGIYIGGGKMVHAPQTGDVVKISPAFWGRDYTGAIRITG